MCGLDIIDKGSDGVDGIVVGSRPELCHGDQFVDFYVHIYLLSNDLFHQLACAFQQADGLVCLGLAVVGLVGFVEDDHCGILPWVGPRFYG